MIWVVFALLTCSAVLSILWPLTGPAPTPREDAADVAFYRAQIVEIEAELSRGGIDSDQAGTAKAQAARRLLAAAPEEVAVGDSPFGRQIAVILAALFVPALALSLYAKIGHPNLPDLPLQARLNAPPARDFSAVVAKMENHVAAHPEDGRALEMMAPVYLRAGRYDDAVNATRRAMEILGESPDRLVKYAEALSYANDGVVSPEAVDQLEHALALAPKNLQARYFLGLAAAQHDDRAKAREVWTAMLAEMPEGSRARQDVSEKLAMLDAPLEAEPAQGSERSAASLPADRQQKSIRAMVDRLAQRLDEHGGSAEEWMRLIRAYNALDEKEKAQKTYDRARAAYSGEPASQQKLATLAQELGLTGK